MLLSLIVNIQHLLEQEEVDIILYICVCVYVRVLIFLIYNEYTDIQVLSARQVIC
ncbi:hypothetical protein HanIR_Chr03g0103541 [Helianthus annuus]|nr:hypothetical protein HanIR_Chr03g0103541 [Helianthus annuus]